MQKILCDECKKKKCPQRIKGSFCMVDEQLGELAVVLETRDPILFARKFTDILESERERYDKAKAIERIGEKEIFTYIDKKGKKRTVAKTKGIDKKISDLAFSILKGAKVISEIVSPKSDVLQPSIGNQNILIVNELRSLPEAYRALFIKKFIDDKLDAPKKDRAITVSGDAPAT